MLIFAHIKQNKQKIIMARNNKKRGFRHSLTFKILCGLVVLFLLGMAYNFIVAENDEISEEEKVEEEQRKAALDTLDVIGDYLWPASKPSQEDLLTGDEKAALEEAKNKKAEDKETQKAVKKESDEMNSEVSNPIPAPAADPVPTISPKPAPAPSIEKVESPRVEQLE